MQLLRPRFLLGNTLCVAVNALHRVDIVGTLRGLESRIHGFDVEAAVRQLRMAGCARCSRLLAVFLVAGETTEAFVDSGGRAVVAGADLAAGLRGVALVAESLTLVRADLDPAGAFVHLWER